MLNWLKKYWLALVLIAFGIAILDGTLSSLMTCHPYDQSAANQQTNPESCSVFKGPILVSLVAIADWMDSYGEAITAAFTIVLALSTIGLWQSTKHLWTTTKTAVDLANKEFASTHRPRMRLKHAWFVDQAAWRIGGPLEINLDFVNIGNTSAHIEWVNYQSLLVPRNQRLPQRPPYDEPSPPNFGPITRFRTVGDLPSGITMPRPVCDGILDPQDVHDILWGHKRLYLIGTIEYWDYAGLRQTAFCRRLTYKSYPPDPSDTGRFVIKKDPDYEYED
jgi:hypothetical protein